MTFTFHIVVVIAIVAHMQSIKEGKPINHLIKFKLQNSWQKSCGLCGGLGVGGGESKIAK